MLRRKGLCIVMAFVMASLVAAAGCGSKAQDNTTGGKDNVEPAAETSGSVQPDAGEEDTDSGKSEGADLTMLINADNALGGIQAVCDLAEKKMGIHVEIETRVGGSDGDNIVKTRLASGEMADICVYNSGATFAALNPEEYFIDLTDEAWMGNLDDNYLQSVTVKDKVYGIPSASMNCGVILYNKDIYDKYKLSVPKTWDEFMANCETIKKGGETALIGSLATPWTGQVIQLGDFYNVNAQDPAFAQEFQKGSAKYADTPAALRSFEKLEETIPYYNEDFLATTYDDACDKLANAEGAHWPILSYAIQNIYELYGEEAANKIGAFAVPGDSADNNGITVWIPESFYGNKNSENIEAIKQFFEFYITPEALDAYCSALLPDGPFCEKGYELPDNVYDMVKQEQSYIEAGKWGTAMEFQTSVKGADLPAICQELISGQTTAKKAAQKYDDDCLKAAVQMGLDWK
ncbi:ABC transporter substrate-binding protein [Diplocloster modestus]|uniref:ABC transporter substrate-binding protein n=1 Tax=Diplocloster modestus TaxID=2850322 RepID=UPI001EE85022|nr:extracellular solute-binding protein [Diplocloster modestus]